jgi:3-dehydroquinate synthase
MEIIDVRLAQRSYPIYVEPGGLDHLGALYRRHGLGPRAALITDELVRPLWADQALQSLESSGVETLLITLPPGEEHKSLVSADHLYEKLIEAGLDRKATIIALGGGVIGDLAGFVAATYLRGVAYIQIATTLIAQVDSSVGGKTGVNHRLGKNLVGAFYQPRLVLIDPGLLRTLPMRERWCGMSEVLKYGLIRDLELFEPLESELTDLVELRDLEKLSRIIARCCQIKAAIISQDERESDLRRLLNFGHTIGHALEAASRYALKHGEAVAWGMLAATWLSFAKGSLDEGEWARITHTLEKIHRPALGAYDDQTVLKYIHRDKKVQDGRIHFVFLHGIGEAFVCPEVDDQDLRDALGYLRTRDATRA